jgi:hypothetical protein
VILSEIRAYLEERGQATLTDMMAHFDSKPDALRPMLDLWVRKGVIERLTAPPDCGGNCNRCTAEAAEVYRWKGSRGPR